MEIAALWNPDRGDTRAKAVLGLLAASFVVALFNHGFVPSMEPRMAEVVREMIAAGEWTIPIKNGVPYVEYPVFYYWLAIAAKSLGLPMTAAIRLPTFLAFFGWLYLLGRWQRYMPTKLPAYAFRLSGAALPLVLFQFSIAQTDGPLAFGVMLSMYGYTLLIAGQKVERFPWAIWGGAAVALLAKGPVGIACTLPVIFLDRVVAGWLSARESTERGTVAKVRSMAVALLPICWVRGLSLVLLVSVPWYVWAGLNRGWTFVDAILIYQNVERYVTGYSHAHPWWYYLKTLIYDGFPLSIVFPAGLWLAAKRIGNPVIRFTLLWALFTFLFFTISGSKQGKYLLPMSPSIVAISLMAVERLGETYRRDLWRWVRRWSMALILTFSALTIVVLPLFSSTLGGVDGFMPIKEQIEKEPGRLIHFQWPRSLTLYQLGAPMPFVRSARELYAGIASGVFRADDYVLVPNDLLGYKDGEDPAFRLVPYPSPAIFEVVLEAEIEEPVTLLRVIPGAGQAEMPDTPDPPVLHWREAMFDTD